jgi:prepilin-type N-terminal cleavage/methylation domain-containing protein
MSRPDRRPRAPRGFTMVEVLISMSVMAIIVVSVVPFFRTTVTGFSAMEVRTAVGVTNQQALNDVFVQMTQCKRLFTGDVAGDSNFLQRVVTSRPPELTGNRLPIVQDAGSFTPSSSTFSAASVGNRVFFAGVNGAMSLPTANVVVDTYRFHFYTVGPKQDGKTLGDKPTATIWEWHSTPYADYNQLNALSSTLLTSAIADLATRNIRRAFDVSASTPSAAFYTLLGSAMTNVPTHQLVPDNSFPYKSPKDTLKVITGRMSSGFTYGLSPNGLTAPKFATAGANFPAGFEVLVIGPPAARQVAMRMAVAARGGFKDHIKNEQVVIATIRDIW